MKKNLLVGGVILSQLVFSQVGIKRSTPLTTLDVAGIIRADGGTMPNTGFGTVMAWNSLQPGLGEAEFVNYRGTGGGGFRFYVIGNTGTPTPTNNVAYIAITGAYTQLSDMRIKSNINGVQNGLSQVMAMRPVVYDMHADMQFEKGKVSFGKNDKPIPSIGFLAQELVKILPEAVMVPKDETKELYGINYSAVIPVLTKAIQEQQAEIETLQTENKKLNERLNNIEQRLGTK